MEKYYKIAFIGSGNVSWHLAPAMENAGHSVTEIFSKDKKNSSLLTERLYQAKAVSSLDFSESKADIFIISISDDAIADTAASIILPENKILVHTSGTVGIEVLTAAHSACGVIYPLQTFSKERKMDLSDVPFCIEGSDENIADILSTLCTSISKEVYFLNSAQRKSLHIAAIYACNFTNHLLTISKNILTKEGIPFEVLYSLIAETMNKALEVGPENAQTGPASRKDIKTIEEHLRILKNLPEYKNIYKVLTESILKNEKE